jgi:hypothetical protein
MMYVFIIRFESAPPVFHNQLKVNGDIVSSEDFSLNNTHRAKTWRLLVKSLHCINLAVFLDTSCGGGGQFIRVIPNYCNSGAGILSPNWVVAMSCSLHEAEFDIDLLQEIHLTSNYHKLLRESDSVKRCQELDSEPVEESSGENHTSELSSQNIFSTPSKGKERERSIQSGLDVSPCSQRSTGSISKQLDFKNEGRVMSLSGCFRISGNRDDKLLPPAPTSTSIPLLEELNERSTLLSDQYIAAAQSIRNTGNWCDSSTYVYVCPSTDWTVQFFHLIVVVN